MIDPKKIEQLAKQIHQSVPQGIRDLGQDAEKKIRQILQAQFTRLDLVSREEFDLQSQVLMRTRQKLAALEQRVSVLESRYGVVGTGTMDADSVTELALTDPTTDDNRSPS